MKQELLSRNAARPLLPVNGPAFLVSPRFLRQRLLIYSTARFGVAAAMVVGGWFARYAVGIEQLHQTGLYVLAGCLLVYNIIVFAALYFRSWSEPASYQRLMLMMHVTISLDFVYLTVALWLVGGAASPFSSFYILHIVLAAILLPRTAALMQALFGYILFTLLAVGQALGFVPILAPVGAVAGGYPYDYRFVATLLLVQAILFFVTALLVSGIAIALKRNETALRSLNAELEKLSELRRDFLHVVTHNLKAPASAAAMLLMTVEQLWAADAPEGARQAIARARARVQDLSDLVQDLQRLTALESGALRKQEQTIDLNELVRAMADAHQDMATEKGQTICLELDVSQPGIHGVPRLIHEAAVNYVTNAIKYTPEGGRITLRTRHEEATVFFEVEDTGVGVPPEYVGKLFGEFVRAPAQIAGQRPPGIGLGLSIVKRIIEYHGGRVYLSSDPGGGSLFGFALPESAWSPTI